MQDDLRVLKSLMSSYNSVNGRYHPSASGILQTTDVYGFRASKDSYATNPQATSNLVMCRNTGDGSVYAVVAMSKSGNRFYITESQGATPYTGAWAGSDLAQGELCGPLGYSSNYRGYALNDTSYLWRKWVDG